MTVDVFRQAWPSLVEAIKSKGRVAAIVIGNASVASFDEGVLTLRFPRQGDVKGFQGSKYEDLLKQAITAMFGINVVIRAVTGGGDAPSPCPGAARPRPRPTAPAAPARRPTARLPRLPTGSLRPGSPRPPRRHRITRTTADWAVVSSGTWRRHRDRPARRRAHRVTVGAEARTRSAAPS